MQASSNAMAPDSPECVRCLYVLGQHCLVSAHGPPGSYVVRLSPVYFDIVYILGYSGSDASSTFGPSVSCERRMIGGMSVRPDAARPSFIPGMMVFVIHSISLSMPDIASPRHTRNPTLGYFCMKAAMLLRV